MLCTWQLGISADKRWLLRQLDWQVRAGEFWCVLGKNGAGKTTLLHTLAGVLPPAEGKVLLQDSDIADIAPATLARLRGLMPQSQVDAFQDSVFNAVAIARIPHRLGAGWDTPEDVDAVRAALTRVGMEARIGDDVTRLSGGERQRVALAALMVQSPALLLLDEPVAHQDVAWQLDVMRQLRELSAQRAVVASCHDINHAARFATHVLLLGEGQHWQGPVNEVLDAALLQQVFGCRFRMEGQVWLAH